jgi:hypothetical protein
MAAERWRPCSKAAATKLRLCWDVIKNITLMFHLTCKYAYINKELLIYYFYLSPVKTINFYFTGLQMADIQEEEMLIKLFKRHPRIEIKKCVNCGLIYDEYLKPLRRPKTYLFTFPDHNHH